MANCVITGNVGITCNAKNKLGGLAKRVWRVSDQSAFTYTVSLDGYVDALTFTGTEGLSYIDAVKFAHNSSDVPVKTEGGSLFFRHNVIVKAMPETPEQDAILKEWYLGDGAVIVETQNGEFLLYGAKNGLESTSEGGQNTGESDESDTARTITLAGAEKDMPLRIFLTDYAATKAMIQAQELGAV